MTWVKWLIVIGIGVAVGTGIYIVTKVKQEKARKIGVHVPYGPYEALFMRP